MVPVADEQTANELVNNLLALKNGPDPAFLEQEREEQKRLLEHLHIQQNDLRKQEILGAMTNLLENEINIIQNFHNQRDQSSRSILEREYETNNLLNNVFLNYDRNRQDVIDQITCNEDIQKSAVAALIARNDSRTWGLVEQVRIVESQLAALTLYEIERKKVNQDDQIVSDLHCIFPLALMICFNLGFFLPFPLLLVDQSDRPTHKFDLRFNGFAQTTGPTQTAGNSTFTIQQ